MNIFMWIVQNLFIILFTVLIILIYVWMKNILNYWKDHNVPYIPALPFLGNMKDAVTLRKTGWQTLNNMYNAKEAENKPYIGFLMFYNPAILIRDPEVIKKILITDFYAFTDRYLDADEKHDSISANNMFIIKNPRWRLIRAKFSPFFSTGHLRKMFNLLAECGKELNQYLIALTVNNEKTEIEVKDLAMRYTTDQVTSCAFGVQANCLKDRNAEFFRFGHHIFEFNFYRGLEFTTIFFLPKIAKFFKFKFFSDKTNKFLRETITSIIDEREKNKIVRNDLLDTLIEMKNEKLKLNDTEFIEIKGDLMIAQIAAFFAGGFETAATIISFGLFELAQNQELQIRLRNEIKEFLIRKKGEFVHDDLKELTYLNMVIWETLRMYPPLPFLERQCTKISGYLMDDYNFTVPQGMQIIIPIYAIHRDPNIYEDPNTFNPERFSDENKSKINPCTFLTFGEGNRQCIAKRFGLLQIQIGFIRFLQNHKVHLAKNQSTDIIFEPKSIMIQNIGGVNLSLEKDKLY